MSALRIRFGRPAVCLALLLSCGSAWLGASNSARAAEDTEKSLGELIDLGLERLTEIEIPIVSAASKYEQPENQAPATVTVITADEIKKYGYRTLADILASVKGYFVTDDRNYNHLGIRGFNRLGDFQSRVLLLIDGHRLNENLYGNAPLGSEFPLDIDLIDHIEILHGPSYSLYGSGAMLGVINIITRHGGDVKGGEIAGAHGAFNRSTGRFTLGNRCSNGVDYLLSGTLYRNDGDPHLYFPEYDAPENNHGMADHRDGDKSGNLFLSLSYGDFTLQAATSSREKHIPTAAYGTIFNDPRNKTVDDYSYATLKYLHKFGDQGELMSRLSYNHFNYIGDYPAKSHDSSDVLRSIMIVNKGVGAWLGWDLQVTRKLLERHTIISGFEYRYNVHQDQLTYEHAPYVVYLDDHRSGNDIGVFLQDECRVLSNLAVIVGARYDGYELFGSTANPRLALVWQASPTTTFKLLYGRAFRAPNAFELYYSDGGLTSKSNPDLKSETIDTYEVVGQQAIGRNLRATVSAFTYDIRDMVTQVIDPADGLVVYENAEQVRAVGGEMALEGKWAGGWKSRVSCTIENAEDKTTHEQLNNSPHVLGKANLLIPLLNEAAFAGLELQYTGDRKTLAGNVAEEHLLANLTLFSEKLFKSWELSASVYNLLDELYDDPGSTVHVQDLIEQDGRTFRVKATRRF